jgi:hypothetical protein
MKTHLSWTHTYYGWRFGVTLHFGRSIGVWAQRWVEASVWFGRRGVMFSYLTKPKLLPQDKNVIEEGYL